MSSLPVVSMTCSTWSCSSCVTGACMPLAEERSIPERIYRPGQTQLPTIMWQSLQARYLSRRIELPGQVSKRASRKSAHLVQDVIILGLEMVMQVQPVTVINHKLHDIDLQANIPSCQLIAILVDSQGRLRRSIASAQQACEFNHTS